MISRCVYVYVVALLVGPTPALLAKDTQYQGVVSLPTNIAEMLRERNRGGRGGCPESNIFVHGFHYLNTRLDQTIWFLGAPDHLCETNSFISVIANSSGEWIAGGMAGEDGLESRMLAGVPILFQHSAGLGHFITTEWQVEGPLNFMYYSADGVNWYSVGLPPPVRKVSDDACCDAASIRHLCVADSGTVFISYENSAQFQGSDWSAPVKNSFPANVTWSRISAIPSDARCDGIWPSDFIPRSLRKKTSDGAIFEVSTDWIVRIPGPTR